MLDTCQASTMYSLIDAPGVIGIGSSTLGERPEEALLFLLHHQSMGGPALAWKATRCCSTEDWPRVFGS